MFNNKGAIWVTTLQSSPSGNHIARAIRRLSNDNNYPRNSCRSVGIAAPCYRDPILYRQLTSRWIAKVGQRVEKIIPVHIGQLGLEICYKSVPKLNKNYATSKNTLSYFLNNSPIAKFIRIKLMKIRIREPDYEIKNYLCWFSENTTICLL